MGNETKINPFAIILNAVTKVNPNLASQKEETASQTVVNSELAQAHEIEAQVQEQLLLGKYSVVKPLDVVWVKLICTCATIKKNRMLQKFTAEMLQSKAKSCRR